MNTNEHESKAAKPQTKRRNHESTKRGKRQPTTSNIQRPREEPPLPDNGSSMLGVGCWLGFVWRLGIGFWSCVHSRSFALIRGSKQLLLRRFERCKAPAVNGTRTMLLERHEMPRRAVAFVLRKSVCRVLAIVFPHQLVARDLGQDARGGDGIAACVNLDQ